MRFYFYSKSSPTKEAVGAVEALNREEAIKFFSLSKQLSVSDFLTIFEVRSYDNQNEITQAGKQLLKG